MNNEIWFVAALYGDSLYHDAVADEATADTWLAQHTKANKTTKVKGELQ